MGSEIVSLVQDPNADKWAASRGFEIIKTLQSYDLHIALNQDLNQFKINGVQASDWDSFYSTLYKLTTKIEELKKDSKQIYIQSPELKTIRAAIFFAKLKLRLAPYDLFSDIKEKWIQELLLSSNIGLKGDYILDTD